MWKGLQSWEPPGLRPRWALSCPPFPPELTQTPDIHILEPLVSGHPSRLVCSLPGACSRDMDLTFSWSGAALRPPGSGLGVHSFSKVVLTPRPQDHGSPLTCKVTLPKARVTKERTVQFSVFCECGPESWGPPGKNRWGCLGQSVCVPHSHS